MKTRTALQQKVYDRSTPMQKLLMDDPEAWQRRLDANIAEKNSMAAAWAKGDFSKTVLSYE